MSDPPPSRFARIRNAFFSGAILLAPLLVTLWAFSRIIDLVGGTFRPFFFFYLPASLRDRSSLEILWDILATAIVVILVTLLGYVSSAVFGKMFVRAAERFIHGIPGVNAVYSTVKQVVGAFGTQNRGMYNKVVLIEFPRKGAWTIAFLTNRSRGEAQARAGGDLWTVYVPTTPNPTGGYMILLPPRDVIELDMTVGEGMKMLLSGGTFVPPWADSGARPPGGPPAPPRIPGPGA